MWKTLYVINMVMANKKTNVTAVNENGLVVRLIPYRCPICLGNGIVSRGFYNSTSGQWSTTDISPEICRSCNGTGIVWG